MGALAHPPGAPARDSDFNWRWAEPEYLAVGCCEAFAVAEVSVCCRRAADWEATVELTLAGERPLWLEGTTRGLAVPVRGAAPPLPPVVAEFTHTRLPVFEDSAPILAKDGGRGGRGGRRSNGRALGAAGDGPRAVVADNDAAPTTRDVMARFTLLEPRCLLLPGIEDPDRERTFTGSRTAAAASARAPDSVEVAPLGCDCEWQPVSDVGFDPAFVHTRFPAFDVPTLRCRGALEERSVAVAVGVDSEPEFPFGIIRLVLGIFLAIVTFTLFWVDLFVHTRFPAFDVPTVAGVAGATGPVATTIDAGGGAHATADGFSCVLVLADDALIPTCDVEAAPEFAGPPRQTKLPALEVLTSACEVCVRTVGLRAGIFDADELEPRPLPEGGMHRLS